MRIAIDMMGGDFAPVESIAGVLSFLEKYRDCELLLLGDEAALKEGLGDPGDRVDIDGSWAFTGVQTVDAMAYRTYVSGGATLLVDPDLLVI